MGCIVYGEEKSNSIFFNQPIAQVRIEEYDDLTGCREEDFGPTTTRNGYRLIDINDKHVWLEFGTDCYDDYYPMFIFKHFPKPPGASIQLK